MRLSDIPGVQQKDDSAPITTRIPFTNLPIEIEGMTVMTCSRVTPAFTVRITMTPVVAGDVACAWATDGWAMEVAPIKVRVSAKTA
jgi:hypothetical protein